MKFILLIVFTCQVLIVYGQASPWKRHEGKIETEWASKVDPAKPLAEYPRPQMVREQWLNLNGIWEFAIAPEGEKKTPSSYSESILVPYPVESSLSGIAKPVGKENNAWYRRRISLPRSFKGKNILLHFGAVDWRCEVFVNGTSVGVHEGGYDPFSFNITNMLKASRTFDVVVKVWDPSDDGPQPRGKQVKKPESIWYTPVTGIWQTVWVEAVSPTHIESLHVTPLLDEKQLRVKANITDFRQGDKFLVTATLDQRKIAEVTSDRPHALLTFTEVQPWSPQSPRLYDLSVSIIRKGKLLDNVKSYFAMRKISMAKDKNGIQRMMLNNEFIFQYGPLDQGWWPDGLYTAPSDEALRFDVVKTKEMGFNMIRKHVKVEPARWYYHCDKIGLLVWQDMPSGDMGNQWDSRPGIIGIASEKERTSESEAIFRKEWKAIIDAVYHFPSVVVWVPFNEAWGQFKTDEIVNWTMTYDSSRLVNGASGGNFTKAGHIMDLHNYPSPAMPDPQLFGQTQSIVLGEFGGLGLPLEGHTWQTKNNWGYQSFSNAEELAAKYEAFIKSLQELINQGLSAAVYTQTTDVEIETNGLMTYDRKVIKIPERKLRAVHENLYKVTVN